MLRIAIDAAHCKGCRLCAAFCPKGVIAMSSSLSPMGVNAAEVVDQEACVGCLNCAVVCPDAAIEIFEVEAVGK